jgi:5-methylcytosine-specific restriction enzyme subunit McrC
MDLQRSPRTLLLRERVPRLCRLRRADVDVLLAHHGAHVEVVPTGERGRYRITPTGHAGILTTPNCRLVLRPKIPLSNLFYLIDPHYPFSADHDVAQANPGTEALGFLALRLARLMAERVAAGLHRGYAERAEEGTVLQGRLDVTAQLRSGSPRKDRLHCRYEEFTADVLCNQVPKAVAEQVLASPLVDERVRAALRQALAGFEGVRPVPLGPDSFRLAAPGRLAEPYRALIDVCRLLYEGLCPQADAGPTRCPAFLVNMERVFETYVTRGVVEGLAASAALEVVVQPWMAACEPVPGQPDLYVRPDVLIRRDGRPEVVLDAKWKDVETAWADEADLYQVLAYGTALGTSRCILVYPGRRTQAWSYRMAGAPVTLELRTVRVVGPAERCRRSLGRLVRALA